ncbi:Short-chain dehydrogenase/reductase tropE [Paramyrothecium foliicola]|nr:Short-chain dehydrogenase/reductase tropE [Paramyrothecium foliicola]
MDVTVPASRSGQAFSFTMADKEVILITGANTGIGFETVKCLLESEKPYHVLLGSRSAPRGDDAIALATKTYPNTRSSLELVQIDVSEDKSINAAVELIKSKFGRLDALVNNAGAQFDDFFVEDGPKFRQIFNNTWNVNVTGAQVLTYACAPLLLASASPRLIFLTSGMSNLGAASQRFMPPFKPNPPAGWPKTGVMAIQAYKAAKTGLNMLMLNWHWLLKEDGVRTWAVSPGFLATNLGSERMDKSMAGDSRLGGDLLRRVLEGERDGDVGKVVMQNGQVQGW